MDNLYEKLPDKNSKFLKKLCSKLEKEITKSFNELSVTEKQRKNYFKNLLFSLLF